jgi:hypothetical protein
MAKAYALRPILIGVYSGAKAPGANFPMYEKFVRTLMDHSIENRAHKLMGGRGGSRMAIWCVEHDSMGSMVPIGPVPDMETGPDGVERPTGPTDIAATQLLYNPTCWMCPRNSDVRVVNLFASSRATADISGLDASRFNEKVTVGVRPRSERPTQENERGTGSGSVWD